MTNPKISYFFKKFYHNIIKWWFVIYNPIAKKIWPSKAEKEAAEALERQQEAAASSDSFDTALDEDTSFTDDLNASSSFSTDFDLTDDMGSSDDFGMDLDMDLGMDTSMDASMDGLSTDFSDSLDIDAPIDAFNSATNSYSGLYGQGPVDTSTQSTLDEILGKASSQSSIDNLLAAVQGPTLEPAPTIPDEREAVIEEANAIYKRLRSEAAADEARKQAEIDAVKAQMQV